METIKRAADRGHTNLGWLSSWHSFSFGSYRNPDNVQFGALRVLNDDVIAPGTGFGKHPHQNMEIISIPLVGSLQHTDSMGHVQVINTGDVQVMSAGSGVVHAEKNNSPVAATGFLQIWILPNQQNVSPQYQQKTFSMAERKNELVTIVAPRGSSGSALQIHQNAWLTLGSLEENTTLTYSPKNENNGVFAFVTSGCLAVNNNLLNAKDALQATEGQALQIKAVTSAAILLIEVPMLV